MRGGNAHGAARATARGRARAMMYAGTGAAHLAAAAQDRAEAGEPPAGQACTRSDARWDRWGQPLRAGARRRAAPGRGPREAAAQAEASRGTPCGTPLRPRPAGPRAPRLRSADLLHSRPRLGQSAPRAPYLRTTSGHRSLLALPARSDHSPRESKLREKQKQEKRTSRTGPAHGPARTQGCKMAPDPYRTLDVPRSATQDEIKKAFRAKAQQYHPDVIGPSASVAERAAAEAKFKEANAAYDVGPPARAPARARRRAWCGVSGCTAATGTLDCPAGRDCWHVSCLSPARALGRCSAMP